MSSPRCLVPAILWLTALSGPACGGDRTPEQASASTASAPTAAPVPAEPAAKQPPPAHTPPPAAEEPTVKAVNEPAPAPERAPTKVASTAPATHAIKPANEPVPAEPPAAKAAASATPDSAATAPSSTAAAHGGEDIPCGEKGQPRCPLQAWMEDNLQGAIDRGDLAAVAKDLTKAARFAPDPSWNAGQTGWSALAESGAAAAARGDLDATKLTCKSCHKTWRNKYKQSFRHRPVP